MTTPPIVAAYFPSARLPRTSRPSPCCQSSWMNPRSRHLSRTAGYPVDTIPSGTTTCRATSESFRVPVFVGGDGILARFLLRACLRGLDLLRNLQLPAGQRRQVPRRRVTSLHRPPDPHMGQFQLSEVVAGRDRLKNRP